MAEKQLKNRVCIIGSGNWGSAIAKIVGRNAARLPNFEDRVTMWIAIPEVVDAAKDADILIFVVPHQFVRTICSTLLGKIKPTAAALSLIKKIEKVTSEYGFEPVTYCVRGYPVYHWSNEAVTQRRKKVILNQKKDFNGVQNYQVCRVPKRYRHSAVSEICLCSAAYDLQCANVSEECFRNIMSSDQKLSWKCQMCKCLQPRRDNSNTPVRSVIVESNVTQNDSVDISFLNKSTMARNVNMAPRGRQPKLDTADILQSTLIDDSVCVDNIRDIIREELLLALDMRLPNLNSNSVSNQLDALNQTVATLTTKLNILESKVDLVLKLAISSKAQPQAGTATSASPARRAEPVASSDPLANANSTLTAGTAKPDDLAASAAEVPKFSEQQRKPNLHGPRIKKKRFRCRIKLLLKKAPGGICVCGLRLD
ncbi:hypothetical protein MSG28_002893 [Choristoneura fumiferana]|uniref:Uncharacterized protein n=1 Tax=Choristoneura fumiferana TaxID=7141 RepID=A0ACC0JJQ1_CHOFU|nr:hypothetical protein MSG28_002893 [Choristoneura fumiferana]